MSTYLRKECLVKGLKVALFSFILLPFFVFIPVTSGNSLEPSARELAFQIGVVDRRADLPVHWVTAGGGILAYGTGQYVDFALEDNPFSPVSHLSFNGVISEGLILGRYALLSEEGIGLRIVDLSDSSNPVDLGFYPLPGTTFHLASWGNFLFVSGVGSGIQIFEISLSDMQNPSLNLFERGTIPVADPVTALAASDWKI